MYEVEGFLQGVARGKPCGGVTPCPAVEGLVGGEDAVHAFVQQRKQRVVAQREQQGGGQGEIPCGVRGGVEREQVGEAGGGENGEFACAVKLPAVVGTLDVAVGGFAA